MRNILSERVGKIDASGIRKVFALGAALEDPVNFSIGQPGFDVHEVVKEDATKFEGLLAVPCYDPWFHMTIKADGRTISCDVATDAGDNVKKHSLKAIWFGPYFENHRKKLLSGDIPARVAKFPVVEPLQYIRMGVSRSIFVALKA